MSIFTGKQEETEFRKQKVKKIHGKKSGKLNMVELRETEYVAALTSLFAFSSGKPSLVTSFESTNFWFITVTASIACLIPSWPLSIVLLGSLPGEEDKRQYGGKCILFMALSRVYGRAWNRAIQGEEERIAGTRPKPRLQIHLYQRTGLVFHSLRNKKKHKNPLFH